MPVLIMDMVCPWCKQNTVVQVGPDKLLCKDDRCAWDSLWNSQPDTNHNSLRANTNWLIVLVVVSVLLLAIAVMILRSKSPLIQFRY